MMRVGEEAQQLWDVYSTWSPETNLRKHARNQHGITNVMKSTTRIIAGLTLT